MRDYSLQYLLLKIIRIFCGIINIAFEIAVCISYLSYHTYYLKLPSKEISCLKCHSYVWIPSICLTGMTGTYLVDLNPENDSPDPPYNSQWKEDEKHKLSYANIKTSFLILAWVCMHQSPKRWEENIQKHAYECCWWINCLNLFCFAPLHFVVFYCDLILNKLITIWYLSLS